MFMLEAADSLEKAKNKSIIPTHSQTIPAKNNKRLFVTAGLYLSIFLIISSVFWPNRDREESHDDALVLFLTFGSANNLVRGLPPRKLHAMPGTHDAAGITGGFSRPVDAIVRRQPPNF